MGAEKKWLFTLFSAAFISLLLFLSAISGFNSSYAFSFHKSFPSIIRQGPNYPPSFAYYIYGSNGDAGRIFRLLLAVYHPRNRYLLHLGTEASMVDRNWLVSAVKSVPAIRAFGNVDVIGKPDPMTPMGSSNIAALLRAAAILLKVDSGWDWFITLSATDYPLITQDDLSHVFSSVRRDLSFIDHTSDLGWKEIQRIHPIVVDPGIYLARRTQIFQATEKRSTPDSFKIFTGSPWVTLSRSFLEYCVLGAPEFKNTTLNGDLRYVIWDSPPKMEPHFLNMLDYDQMAQSGAAFARQFQKDDAVLDMVDQRILKRGRNRVTPGAWCNGRKRMWSDPCSLWGDVNAVKPGPQAKKLEDSITNLLDDLTSHSRQCK